MVYQIRKFLQFLKLDFADNIQPPKEQDHTPVRVTKADIDKTINYFGEHDRELQITALINLGIDSGIRANELYQLKIKDIDLDNRIIYINHKPELNQTTKIGKSRISFFIKKNVFYFKRIF